MNNSCLVMFTIVILFLFTATPTAFATLGDLQESVERLNKSLNDIIESDGFYEAMKKESNLAIPNITHYDPPRSLINTEEFAMSAEFEPHEDEFLADNNYW